MLSTANRIRSRSRISPPIEKDGWTRRDRRVYAPFLRPQTGRYWSAGKRTVEEKKRKGKEKERKGNEMKRRKRIVEPGRIQGLRTVCGLGESGTYRTHMDDSVHTKQQNEPGVDRRPNGTLLT